MKIDVCKNLFFFYRKHIWYDTTFLIKKIETESAFDCSIFIYLKKKKNTSNTEFVLL